MTRAPGENSLLRCPSRHSPSCLTEDEYRAAEALKAECLELCAPDDASVSRMMDSTMTGLGPDSLPPSAGEKSMQEGDEVAGADLQLAAEDIFMAADRVADSTKVPVRSDVKVSREVFVWG